MRLKLLLALAPLGVLSLGVVLLASSTGGQARPDGQRQSFGGGSVAVLSLPRVDGVAWVVVGPLVDAVKVKFENGLPAGAKVHVQMRHGSDAISGSQGMSTSGSPGCDDGAGGPLPGGVFCTVDLGTNPSIAAITDLDMTVIGPILVVFDGPAEIDVAVTNWKLLDTDIRLVEKVILEFAQSTAGPDITVRLTLKDPAGLQLARDTRDLTLDSGRPTTLTWDLKMAPNEPVSSEAIARLDIQVRLK